FRAGLSAVRGVQASGVCRPPWQRTRSGRIGHPVAAGRPEIADEAVAVLDTATAQNAFPAPSQTLSEAGVVQAEVLDRPAPSVEDARPHFAAPIQKFCRSTTCPKP